MSRSFEEPAHLRRQIRLHHGAVQRDALMRIENHRATDKTQPSDDGQPLQAPTDFLSSFGRSRNKPGAPPTTPDEQPP